MAVPNRTALIERMHKVLRKHFKPVQPADRDVLGHLLYASVLEFAPYDKAEAAFQRVRGLSFDLNEIRVTTVSELAESMSGARDPKQAAWNFKRLLHDVFESQYSFDLEHIRKQSLGKAQGDLTRLAGATSFIVNYVTQAALGGHAIPLNRGSWDVLFITGIIDADERQQLVAPGLERAISKKHGIEFSSLLHQLGIELWFSPFSPKVRGILVEINPDAKERLPKRQTKSSAPAPKKADPKQSGSSAKGAKTPASHPKKPVPKKSPPGKKPSKKRALTRRTVIHSLSRKKPK